MSAGPEDVDDDDDGGDGAEEAAAGETGGEREGAAPLVDRARAREGTEAMAGLAPEGPRARPAARPKMEEAARIFRGGACVAVGRSPALLAKRFTNFYQRKEHEALA
jgi:hypothetical protein